MIFCCISASHKDLDPLASRIWLAGIDCDRRLDWYLYTDDILRWKSYQSRSQSPRAFWCWQKGTWALGTRLKSYRLKYKDIDIRYRNISGSAKTPDERKKSKEDEQTLADLSSARQLMV